MFAQLQALWLVPDGRDTIRETLPLTAGVMENLNEKILTERGRVQAEGTVPTGDAGRTRRANEANGRPDALREKSNPQGSSGYGRISKENDGLASKGGYLHEQIRPEIWDIWKEIGYKLKGLAPKLLTGTQLASVGRISLRNPPDENLTCILNLS